MVSLKEVRDKVDNILLAKSLSDGKRLRYKVQKNKLHIFLGEPKDPRDKSREPTLFLIIEHDVETDLYVVTIRGLHLLDEDKLDQLEADWFKDSVRDQFVCGTGNLKEFILKYVA